MLRFMGLQRVGHNLVTELQSIHISKMLLLVVRFRYLNYFSAFLCMGRCKNLESVKFFLGYALHLNYLGAHIYKTQNASEPCGQGSVPGDSQRLPSCTLAPKASTRPAGHSSRVTIQKRELDDP